MTFNDGSSDTCFMHNIPIDYMTHLLDLLYYALYTCISEICPLTDYLIKLPMRAITDSHTN